MRKSDKVHDGRGVYMSWQLRPGSQEALMLIHPYPPEQVNQCCTSSLNIRLFFNKFAFKKGNVVELFGNYLVYQYLYDKSHCGNKKFFP